MKLHHYLLLFIGFWAHAQEVQVIDKKGTIQTVTVNNVTEAATAPTDPVEGDVWIDTTTHLTKVWEDGTPTGMWKDVSEIIPLWKSTTNGGDYNTNDLINHNGVIYKNLTGTNTDTTPDLDTTNWVELSTLSIKPSLTGVGKLTDDGTLLLDDTFSTFVQGDYAYVTSRDNLGLQIIDISDPINPIGVGQLVDDATLSFNQLRTVFVQGDYAYTISKTEGLQIIDVSDPTNPVGTGRLVDDGTLLLNGSWDLFVQGNYAYVTSLGEDGIQIIDISDPTNPKGVGQLADDGSLLLGGAFSIFVQGNYAYVTSFLEDGFQIIDISDPTNPVAAGQLAESASVLLETPYYSFVEGNYAYVPSHTEDGLQIIDISDPNNPVAVGQLTDSADLLLDGAFRVFTQGNYAYVTAILEGFQVIDISDPTNPVGVDQLADSGTLHLENARGLFIQGNYAYVSGGQGFQVIELGNNELYGLDVGTLKTSSLQVDNHAQFNNYVDVKGGLSVGASSKFDGNVSLGSSLRDSSGDAGTSGQVLSSTVTGTNWVDASSGGEIIDVDGDTLIQVEEGTDDDTIRFDTAGTERMVIDAAGNVGVGRPSPTELLHVNSRALIDGVSPTLTLQSTSGSGTVQQRLIFETHESFRGGGIEWQETGNSDRRTFLGQPYQSNYLSYAFTTTGEATDRPDSPSVKFKIRNSDGFTSIAGNHNPAKALDVGGEARIRTLAVGAATDEIVTANSNGDLRKLAISQLTPLKLVDTDGDTKIQVEKTADDDTIRFDTAGTERMLIDNDGNVGINISDPSDLFQVHSDEISSLSDTTTTHEITTVLTQADANWHELIPDVTGLYIKPDGLSLGTFAIGTANNIHIQSFTEENTISRGIVVSDPTIVVDEVQTSYWYYVADGGYIKAVLVEFRLNGAALEARRVSARYRSFASAPGYVTVDRQNNAWFTGAGWSTPGAYQIDLIRVTAQDVLGTYSSNVIVATKTGKVGINVDAPSEALEVNGNTYLRGALLDSSGNAGTSGQVLSSTVTGTSWVDGGNDDAWGVTGEDTVSDISRTGRVTVNKSARDAFKLQTTDNTLDVGLAFQNSGGYYSSSIYRKGGGVGEIDLVFAIGSGYPDVGSIPERMRITEDGMIGIGTADPTNSLHINGDNAGINISDNANAGNNIALKMYHGGSSGKGMGFTWNGTTNTTGSLVIQSLSNTGGFVSNLHGFARNGNVGIGTITPAQTLDVVGTGLFRKGGINTATTGNEQLLFSYNNGVNYKQGIRTRHNSFAIDGNAIDFYTWNFGTDANDANPSLLGMSINGGRVGIGTLNPTQALDVNGNIAVQGTTVHTSDRRLKKKIKPLENSLNKLLKLNGVSYLWKNKELSEDKQLGVIAQDVEGVIPEVVNNDGEYKSVNYEGLIPVLIEAVKEQQKLIKKLEKRIETLER